VLVTNEGRGEVRGVRHCEERGDQVKRRVGRKKKISSVMGLLFGLWFVKSLVFFFFRWKGGIRFILLFLFLFLVLFLFLFIGLLKI
jgi:hypothetical protein